MPYALAIGISYETFWHLNPHKLKPFIKAQELKRKIQDEMMWMMGMYVNNAVSVAVEHNLAGRKAKSKYMEKPMLQDQKITGEPKELTHEEKMKQVHAIFATLEARKANWDLNKAKNGNG